MSDETHMRRAIALAAANVGKTAENPSVGCVIVRDGVVIGEGATAPGGRPHAEEQALIEAGHAARGATAYVTLEPCGARSSGTASCSERLNTAGVARVVVACEDTSPFAAGRGLERLRGAGITVELGLLHDEAQSLYAAYRPPPHGPQIG
jgi:pyrimidine deaminase RibD-like protein